MVCRADTSIKIQALSLLLYQLLKIVLTFSQLVFCYSWNLSLFLYFKHFQMTSAYRPHNRAKKIIRSHFKFIKDFIISRDSYAMNFELKLNTQYYEKSYIVCLFVLFVYFAIIRSTVRLFKGQQY